MLVFRPQPSRVFPSSLEWKPGLKALSSLVAPASLTSSPAYSLLADAVSATLAPLAVLPPTKPVSAAGPLQLVLLSGHCLSSAILVPSLPSSLSPNISISERFSVTKYRQQKPPKILWKDYFLQPLNILIGKQNFFSLSNTPLHNTLNKSKV